MSEDGPASPPLRLLRWSGFVLVAAGVLMAVATPLHPSRETPATIIASEVRLVASHVLSTLSSLLVLLELPGLYVAHRAGMGRLGFGGFLGAFTGTYLLAVSGNFGFLAPVLAKESPAILDAILLYLGDDLGRLAWGRPMPFITRGRRDRWDRDPEYMRNRAVVRSQRRLLRPVWRGDRLRRAVLVDRQCATPGQFAGVQIWVSRRPVL